MSETDGSTSDRTATDRTAPEAAAPDHGTTGGPATDRTAIDRTAADRPAAGHRASEQAVADRATDSVAEGASPEAPDGPAESASALAPSRRWLVVAALVPLAAWSASFLGSYALQDFTCHAAASADRMLSPTTLPVFLLVANALLLVISLAAAVAGQFWLRRHRMEQVDRFLARTALAGGLLFGFSIILIGINPALFEVCT